MVVRVYLSVRIYPTLPEWFSTFLKGTGTATNPELTCFEADGYEREEESEVFSENQSFTAHRSSYRRSRRRSSHSEKDRDDPEEDMYIDDEQVLFTISIFLPSGKLCRRIPLQTVWTQISPDKTFDLI